MSKAATNASSNSEDDGNDGCNLQGIYDNRMKGFLAQITFYYKL